MNPDEISDVLTQSRNLQVATMGSDGFPHLTTLWFVLIDGIVTFRSFTKSQRVVNLMRNPRLTVLAESGTGYAELRGVMVKGTAQIDTDPESVLEIYRRVSSKMEGAEMTTDAAAAMFGRFLAKNVVIRVEPSSVISWDHSKLSGSY